MQKAAVIGLGDISQIHIPAIRRLENAVIQAVCDIDEGKRGIVEEAAFYTDYKEMIEREELDGVHICLPHYLHVPVARYCAEKGLHVFVEKPLGLNYVQAAQLAETEKKHPEVKLCLCLQNRLNETTEEMMRIVQEGAYGRLLGIKGLVAWHRPKEYYDCKPWRGLMEYAGGGSMINQSVHTMDLMQLLGGRISGIRGNIAQLLDYGIEVEDTANVRILFENGAVGNFYSTNANPENSSVEVELLFEHARFTMRDNTLWRTDGEKKEKLAEDLRLPGTKFYYGASHSKLIEKFYRAIEEGTEDYIHVSEGLISMQMIDAVCLSSKENRIVRMEEIIK